MKPLLFTVVYKVLLIFSSFQPHLILLSYVFTKQLHTVFFMFLKHTRSFCALSSYFQLGAGMIFATSLHSYFSDLKAKVTFAGRTSLSPLSKVASPRYSIASLCLFLLLYSNCDYLTHYFLFVDCLPHKNVTTLRAESWTHLLTLNPQSLA